MGTGQARHRTWLLVAWATLVVVAVADAWTPLGFAHGSLYLVPLLLAAASGHARWMAAVGVAGAVLTFVGVALSPPAPEGIGPAIYWGNRVSSALLLAPTAVLAWRWMTTARALTAANAARAQEAWLVSIAATTARFGGWSVDVASREVSWSASVAELFGYDDTNHLSLETVLDRYDVADRRTVEASFEACARDATPYDFEARLRPADTDTILWVRVTGRAVQDADGRVVRVEGAVQDVDERRRTAAALAEAEERARVRSDTLAATLDQISDAFFALDREWRFTYVNPEAERVLQRRRADLFGGTIWAAFPAAIGTTFEVNYRAAMDEGATRQFEAYFPPLDLWVEVRAHPVDDGLAVYFQDIGPRRAADAQRRVLRDAVEQLDDAVIITEIALGGGAAVPGVVFANAAWERMMGQPRAALTGDGDEGTWLLDGVDAEPQELARVRAAMGARAPTRAVVRSRRDDEGRAWLDLRIAPVADERGQPSHWVAVARDVTEQRALQAQLHRVQRLESIGHLTGGLAHDFNNLLTVMGGNADLLVRRLADRPTEARMASMVAEAAQRGAELTHSLLAFARQQPLEPRAVDAGALVQGMRALLERTLGEMVEVHVAVTPDLPATFVDPHQLESALLNLALNARDAMQDGGQLTIEVGDVELDERQAHRYEEMEPGAYVRLAVSDTGGGIAAADLDHVFQPFYSTKPAGQGTGLGLPMVYGFAKQSRGHVSLYSEVGVGTTVLLYLPRHVGSAEPTPVRPVDTEAPTGTEGVLVVEDDAMVRAFASEQLAALGYQVVVAADGPSALRVLDEHPDVALLFTDVVMPGGMSGKQLADEATARRPGLRVLYASGYTENAIVHHGRLDPGVALLTKPYRRADLARRVRDVLDATG